MMVKDEIKTSQNLLYILKYLIKNDIKEVVFIDTCIDITRYIIIPPSENKIILSSKEEANEMKRTIMKTTLNCLLIEMLCNYMIRNIGQPYNIRTLSNIDKCEEYIDNNINYHIENSINTLDIDEIVKKIEELLIC